MSDQPAHFCERGVRNHCWASRQAIVIMAAWSKAPVWGGGRSGPWSWRADLQLRLTKPR